MKIIIAGGRKFNNYKLLKEKIDRFIQTIPDCFIDDGANTIISGCAKGADRLGERYANENNMELVRMPADWKTHGRSAGFRRNEEMAKAGHALIAFWDGVSKGTGYMIDVARAKKLIVKVVMYEDFQ